MEVEKEAIMKRQESNKIEKSGGNNKKSEVPLKEEALYCDMEHVDSGFFCQSGIVARKNEEKVLELYPNPAKDKNPDIQNYLGINAYWCGIMGDSSNFRREEFSLKQVLPFDATTGQVVKGS
ncbi:17583_t:CDS:2, partial [Gigaspora rosea]